MTLLGAALRNPLWARRCLREGDNRSQGSLGSSSSTAGILGGCLCCSPRLVAQPHLFAFSAPGRDRAPGDAGWQCLRMGYLLLPSLRVLCHLCCFPPHPFCQAPTSLWAWGPSSCCRVGFQPQRSAPRSGSPLQQSAFGSRGAAEGRGPVPGRRGGTSSSGISPPPAATPGLGTWQWQWHWPCPSAVARRSSRRRTGQLRRPPPGPLPRRDAAQAPRGHGGTAEQHH